MSRKPTTSRHFDALSEDRNQTHATRNRDKIVKLLAQEQLEGRNTGWFHRESLGQKEMLVFNDRCKIRFYDGSEAIITQNEVTAAARRAQLASPREEVRQPLQLAAGPDTTAQQGDGPRPGAASVQYG